MHKFSQIRYLLQNSSEFRLHIVRNLVGRSTIALFGVFISQGADHLRFAGTGTLVVFDQCYYILTAAHVWDFLKSAVKLGITLTDRIDHKYLIDLYAIIPTMIKPDNSNWNEWGPDLALLRIPDGLVGTIQAYKAFEDLKAPRKHLHQEAGECWVAMGTPDELGTFTQNHAEVQICGDIVSPEHLCRDNHDYFDFQVDTTRTDMPKDFGGFSGGGLWRVMLYWSPQTNKIDSEQRLRGVIFWQFPPVNGTRIIRAHGPQSIFSELLQNSSAYDVLKYDSETG